MMNLEGRETELARKNSRDHFDVFGASDIGRKRSENQDHFLVGELRRQLIVHQTDVPETRTSSLVGCQEGRLLVVADGMGGHHGGEQASRTAVEASARYVLDMMQWFLKLSIDDEQDFKEELANCLTQVQKKIWSVSVGPCGQSERSMGTTVTMAYVLWPRMFIVHAGDSRCYLLRDGALRQMTTDHTIAQQLIDSGGMLADDPALTNWRHVLWNCVGGGREKVHPEVIRSHLQVGDVLILCSDGLTGMVDDAQITSIVSSSTSAEDATKKLIQAANDAGGCDNISAIVCRIDHQIDDVEDCENEPSSLADTTIIT